MTAVAAFVGTLVVFAVVDLVWLGVIAKEFYRSQLAGLMVEKIRIVPAVIFYLVFCTGLVLLAVMPALKAGSWLEAAKLGAMIGFMAYATYDLTNLATLKGWPLAMSLVDMAWGTVLSATAAVGGYAAARAFG